MSDFTFAVPCLTLYLYPRFAKTAWTPASKSLKCFVHITNLTKWFFAANEMGNLWFLYLIYHYHQQMDSIVLKDSFKFVIWRILISIPSSNFSVSIILITCWREVFYCNTPNFFFPLVIFSFGLRSTSLYHILIFSFQWHNISLNAW